MKNNMTNWIPKRIFATHLYKFILPKIYLDEYWDYYIKEYNLQEEWEKFLNIFLDEKYTYESFENEYRQLSLDCSSYINNSLWGEEQ